MIFKTSITASASKYVQWIFPLQKFKIDNDRTESFTLNHMVLTHYGCESLEEIFKRVQFDHINLIDCGLTSETAFALFEMFEYYESTTRLNISSNGNLGLRGWQACSRYIKKVNDFFSTCN